MKKLKEFAKKIPVLPSLYRRLHNKYISYRLKSKNAEQVFTDICRSNVWSGKNSVSGPGSDDDQTRISTQELSGVFRDYRVSTLLDIPCGDFHWMKNVDLIDIDYTGADIVHDLIEKNTEQYGRDGLRFQKLDLIKDTLPKVDLVFCRDCLVHLSFKDIFRAFDNLCTSQSEYFLTTTFVARTKNRDIATGQWRTLNLELAPFTLPSPLKIINEGCTEGRGAYSDKSLGLWRIVDIRESLIRRCP
ncbi:MAG TPA: class I SAM-dependent methyltransferase [Coleofasciculaceae cyanobacterium]